MVGVGAGGGVGTGGGATVTGGGVLVGGAGVEPTSPPPEPPPPQADKLSSARVAADPKNAFAIHTLSQIVRFAQFP
jgi:hypothetical protein